MTTLIYWRIFVGPAYLPAGNAAHYDWSVLDDGATPSLGVATTLASTLASGATSASIASATNWGTTGGAWIGPNGSGQAWEYVGFTGRSGTTLSGLIRESTTWRDHNGAHTSGATVYRWYPITQNDGRLRLVEELDETLSATSWYAELSGIAAPQVVFRQNHVVLIQTRELPSASWTNYLVGFLDYASIKDDHTRVRGWSARIYALPGILAKTRAKGFRMGDFDLAVHGQAQSSTALPTQAAHKERRSGDFTAAAPDFSADSAIEDDNETLWMADEMVGTTQTPDTGYGGFTQLYINPPPTMNKGYRWLEIFNRTTAGIQLVAWDSDSEDEHTLDIPSIDLTDGEDDDHYMIICENESLFLAENPSQRAVRVYSVEESDDPDWFDHLLPEGGAVAFKFFSDYQDGICWGTVETGDPTDWDDFDFDGDPIDAPGYDQTMRFKHLDNGHTDTADDWQVGYAQSPGYTIQDEDNVWLFVELPGMGLRLRDDMTDASPGNGGTLYIVDASGPSTNGLPSSGTLQIGDEHIAYSSKTDEAVVLAGSGARGADSTTAAPHNEGDALFLKFTQNGVTAITDALPLKETAWYRYNGTIYPEALTIRWSMLTARTPAESLHENDYELYQEYDASDTLGESSQVVSHSPAVRARCILFEIHKMTEDPARPRINHVAARVDPAFFDGDTWFDGGETVEEMIEAIILNAGVPTGAVDVTGGGAEVEGFVTDSAPCWSVVVDAAEFGGSVIDTGRDSKIAIAPDELWTTAVGGMVAAETWDRANAASVEKIHRGGGSISQVRLAWQTPDKSESGTEVYPASVDWLGSPQELGPLVYADATAAQLSARKRYFLSRYPYEYLVECAEGDLTLRPRQVHGLYWQFADDMQPASRTLLIVSAEHQIEDMALSSVFSAIQIDREDEG